MPLQKIKDFDPDYRNFFGDHDILGYDLYSGNDKVGSIDDLLVDEEGRFRYLVINTGAWIFGKKVLLPIGRARISYPDRRIYVDGLTRRQVEDLPEYNGTDPVDYDQEERVRGVYRGTNAAAVDPLNPIATPATERPLEQDVTARPAVGRDVTNPLDRGVAANRAVDRDVESPLYDRNAYNYDRDPDLYGLNEQNHQNLRLYEERLITNKARRKTGEVSVGKRVETEQARASVPVEKERVVIERGTPTDTTVPPGADAFNEGEAVRMEIYEETPDIRKEAFVREEVNVRKEIDRDTVEANETLRKERLEVNKQGGVVDGPDDIRDERPINERVRDQRVRDERL